MAWTAPMTATDNTIWTSSQWNTHVRDNLNETMPGKATAAGQWFVSTGANAIAARTISSATVSTSQTTTSTSFTDLTTVGPQVTVTTGTRAMVFFGTSGSNSTANAATLASVGVTGASTIAAATSRELKIDGTDASSAWRACTFLYYDTLTAGSNTFTMKYAVSSGTGTFSDRELLVLPL